MAIRPTTVPLTEAKGYDSALLDAMKARKGNVHVMKQFPKIFSPRCYVLRPPREFQVWSSNVALAITQNEFVQNRQGKKEKGAIGGAKGLLGKSWLR